MTGEQLLEEGQKIARPCVYLNDVGEGEIAALWGGAGVVESPEGPYKHWLSLDCQFLPQNPANLTGCLSIYTDEEDIEGGIVAPDANISLPSAENGSIPLFGQKSLSLPPIDAVFQFGSAAVQDWLSSYGWKPDWGYNDNFKGRDIVAEYESAIQKVSPIYNASTFAQLGGWNIPWPEDDWDELLDQILLVWTFKDAEPWVEVWLDNAQTMRVIQRIT